MTANTVGARQVYVPRQNGDPALGPLQLLPGIWRNEPNLPGRGWNM